MTVVELNVELACVIELCLFCKPAAMESWGRNWEGGCTFVLLSWAWSFLAMNALLEEHL